MSCWLAEFQSHFKKVISFVGQNQGPEWLNYTNVHTKKIFN